ncbi:replication-associated recombination protein A [Mycoplasmopsis lipophila]|uniref:replication-associated recombination protein A n=1 Tax=Mycoplasmopsis lipophila TaxID=2117 RepID=UPI003873292C
MNLANKIRPSSLEDIIGQQEIVTLLQRTVKKKYLSNFIFYGEPGIGKTSIAIALANEHKLKYGIFNAANDSKNDLLNLIQTKDLIIIDEIHRMNKDKQDILLSYLENDKVLVYATTTENPYFRINPAIRSRMQILELKKISIEEIIKGLKKIKNKYFPELKIKDEIFKELAYLGNGDLRICINNLQMLCTLSEKKEIDKNDLKIIIPNINFFSDKNGDSHYNNLSAFHKSLRGSDANAALYYGNLILKTGDLIGLYRRITAVAYEDIGLANSTIQLKVEAAINAAERLGFPEAYLPLNYIIMLLALSPKSNSVYCALNKANKLIEQGKNFDIPDYLKDAHYASAKKLNRGIGYKYPHDYHNSIIYQEYLPKEIKDEKFYFPKDNDDPKIVNYFNLVTNLKKEKGD